MPDPKNPGAITIGVRPGVLPICRLCGATRSGRQIGQEPLHDCGAWASGQPECGACYVCHMVQVLRNVRRALRDDGLIFLNIADSYAGSWGNYGARHGQQRQASTERLPRKAYDTNTARPPTSGTGTGLKPKDRAGIPERLILALQADGWWYRSDITWAKVAAMPESVTDRPSRASEHIYMLAKSAHYYYDNDGYREPLAESTIADPRNGTGRHTQGKAVSKYYDAQTPDGTAADMPSWYRAKSFVNPSAGRNARDVWSLTPEASNLAFCAACGEAYATAQMKRFQTTPDGKRICPNCQASDRWVAHFAAYPSELPRRAILLGTSERGVCPNCGAPWARVVAKAGTGPQRQTRKHDQTRLNTLAGSEYQEWRNAHPDVTTGWQPTCACFDYANPDPEAGDETKRPLPPIPATVLDPFVGSGTTLITAKQLGRHGIGIDLRADYVALTAARLARTQPALVAPPAEEQDPEPAATQLALEL